MSLLVSTAIFKWPFSKKFFSESEKPKLQALADSINRCRMNSALLEVVQEDLIENYD